MKKKGKTKIENIVPKKKPEVKPEAGKTEVKELFDLEPQIENVKYENKVEKKKQKALKKKEIKPERKEAPEKPKEKPVKEIVKEVEKKKLKKMEVKPEKKIERVKHENKVEKKHKIKKEEVKPEKKIGGGSFIASGILSVVVPAVFYIVLGDFNSFLKDCSLPFSTVDIGNSTVVNCNEIRLVYIISILCVFFGLILIVWGFARKMSEQES